MSRPSSSHEEEPGTAWHLIVRGEHLTGAFDAAMLAIMNASVTTGAENDSVRSVATRFQARCPELPALLGQLLDDLAEEQESMPGALIDVSVDNVISGEHGWSAWGTAHFGLGPASGSLVHRVIGTAKIERFPATTTIEAMLKPRGSVP